MTYKAVYSLTMWFAVAGTLCCTDAKGAFVFQIDDFSTPTSTTQASLPGESRAAFPPGTSGGSIIALPAGANIALDRGLFASDGGITAGAGQMNFSVPTGFVEFDWNVDGFDFVASDARNVVLDGLTNNSGQQISLSIELFQTFNGTASVIGTGVVPIILDDGESRNVSFSAVAGASDFAGFRLVNNSANTFIGSISSVSAIPEPSAVPLVGLLLVTVIARRRRKRDRVNTVRQTVC